MKAILERGFKDLNTEEVLNKLKIKGDVNMLQCVEMLQREMKREKKEAREAGRLEIIKNMLKEKFSISEIIKVSGMKEQEIERIAKEMKVM